MYIIGIRYKLKDALDGDDIYAFSDIEIEEVLAKILLERKLTIATAESCTGGLVAATLVNHLGISQVFLEGVITHTNEAKHATVITGINMLRKMIL